MVAMNKIVEAIGAQLVENQAVESVTGLNSLDQARENELTFLSNEKYFSLALETKACAMIIDQKGYEQLNKKREDLSYLIVDDPYLAFAQALKFFDPQPRPNEEVSDQAFVDQSATIGEKVSIYPGCYIGKNVKIGNHTVIYPNCTIEDNSIIGEHTIIYSNVVVRYNSQVGNHVVIHSGTVIGSDGFGFAPDSNRKFEKIPQIGIVVIEDYVEIGSNVSIDRAALGETRICEGVKLDNLIQVGHNVTIGKDTVIAAQTGIAGSTHIGEFNMIGGQVGFSGHTSTGNHVMIAAKSGVHKDLKEGEVVFGYPARPIGHSRRIEALLNHLPDSIKLLRKIAKQLNISLKD